MDLDTFLTGLYITVDDFMISVSEKYRSVGRRPALSTSEVITLAMLSQVSRFRSERDFYRWAQERLRSYFPQMPKRSQFNRCLRNVRCYIEAFWLWLIRSERHDFEAMDCCAIQTRDRRRRGRGWLAGQANIGLSNRLGWYEGLHLLTSVSPAGVITGYCVAPASAKDQRMAEQFFATRQKPCPELQTIGDERTHYYLVDKGFSGPHLHATWKRTYKIEVICAPQKGHKGYPWPKPLRQWLASLRQIVETVNEKLLNAFRLDRERPHCLQGVLARLAAKVAMHNYCIQLNRSIGRNQLAFADLIHW